MKVLFLIDRFPVISETFIYNQIYGVSKLGIKVDVLIIYKGENVGAKDILQDIIGSIHYLNMPSNKIFRLLKSIKLICSKLLNLQNLMILLKSLNFFRYGFNSVSLKFLFLANKIINLGNDFDIIHAHFGHIGNHAVVLKKLGIKGRVFVSFHGSDVSAFVRLHGKNIFSDVFKEAALITANSNYTKGKLIEIGCDSNKIIIINESLDIDKFKFRCRKLNPNETIKILTVARLVQKKGLEYSIRAVAAAQVKYKNLQYDIFGEGPLWENLKKIIFDLGVQGSIVLRGSAKWNKINDIYNEAHIFILASVSAADGDEEGQGLVLQEAQALGIPVIATNHNGFPEGIINGKSGFLIPERNVEALAEKLIWLINNSQSWSEMGQIGRKFIESKYDYRLISQQLRQCYEKYSRTTKS